MSWWSGILDLLFPARCALCGGLLREKGPFCPGCGEKMARIPDEKMVREGAWGRCVSVLYYDDRTREAVHAFKFGGQSWRAAALGELMARAASERLGGEFDVVTWVPVSRKRLRKRGYDQSRLLAEEMCRLWRVRPEPLLRKILDNPAQSSLEGAAARRGNVLGAYEPAPGAAIRGRRVLLVDDVLTTGSTLAECARVLRLAEAADVVCVTLAAAGGEKKKEEKTP